MSDGVNSYIYPVYPNAFSNDVLIRVGRSTDAVLQDLDYILGKLNGMTEDEFHKTLNPPQQENDLSQPKPNYWHLTNPIWWLWEIVKFTWKHKIVSAAVLILGLLATDYSLAWRNAILVKDFFCRFF